MAPDRESLESQVRTLQDRLAEANEVIRALSSGEVDAVVVAAPEGNRVYTLKGADEAYRKIVLGMAEGALTLTLDGLIVFANEQFAGMIGGPLERVLGARLAEFVADEDLPALAALLAGEGSRKTELRLKSVGGSVLVPVYLSADQMVLDEAECLCVIVTDLTEQKRNEEVVAAERLARSILDQAAEAIVVTDREGRITRANQAAAQFSGASVVHRKFDDVFHIRLSTGESFPFQSILEAARRTPTLNGLEASAVTANGREAELLFSAACLSAPDGSILGW